MIYNNGNRQVNAIQWSGNNYREVQAFCGWCLSNAKNGVIAVPTAQGWKFCNVGDYITRMNETFDVESKKVFEEDYAASAFWN